jgi:hypothetical protein
VTSDDGLFLVRELDGRLGLVELIKRHLADARVKSTQLARPTSCGSQITAD